MTCANADPYVSNNVAVMTPLVPSQPYTPPFKLISPPPLFLYSPYLLSFYFPHAPSHVTFLFFPIYTPLLPSQTPTHNTLYISFPTLITIIISN